MAKAVAKPKGTKKERVEKLDEILDIKTSQEIVDDSSLAFSVTHGTFQVKLEDLIDLAEDNPIKAVLYSKDSLLPAEERFEAVKTGVQINIAPLLDQYLQSLNIAEELKKVTTVEQLAATQIIYVPIDFRKKLAEYLDGLTGFEAYQKVWLFMLFVDMFARGAETRCSPLFEKRAQDIMNAKRIIQV